MESRVWERDLGAKRYGAIRGRLVKGEEILDVSRIHPGIYLPPALTAVIALCLGLFVAPQLMYVLGTAAALMGLYAMARRSILLIVVTNKRLIARTGLIKIDFIDMRLQTIESIESERMLIGYLMGYANVVVMGTGNRYITIPYVANAEALRNRFNQILLTE